MRCDIESTQHKDWGQEEANSKHQRDDDEEEIMLKPGIGAE